MKVLERLEKLNFWNLNCLQKNRHLKLIGNKSEFAVEYKISDIPSMMGYGKLWIQGKFYGTNQDLITSDDDVRLAIAKSATYRRYVIAKQKLKMNKVEFK